MGLFRKDDTVKPTGTEHKDHDFVTGSSVEKKHLRNHAIVVSGITLIAIVAITTTLFLNKDTIIEYGNTYLAAFDTADEISELEENGYTFAFGTEPSDPRDFSDFSLPEADPELKAQFTEAVNTSPAFEEIDNVNEILEYDQLDKDGNISEDAMREIIAIAEETEE